MPADSTHNADYVRPWWLEGFLKLFTEDWRADAPVAKQPWEGNATEVWNAVGQAKTLCVIIEKKLARPQKPNIDHLIRARYVEMGFSDEFIAEIEAFTEAEAERLRALRNDGPLGPEESDTSGAYRTGDVTVLGDLIDSEVVEWPAHRDGSQ